jgi:YHS domain-containing protein
LISADGAEGYHQHVQMDVTENSAFEDRAPFANEQAEFRGQEYYFCKKFKKLEDNFLLKNECVKKTIGECISQLGTDSEDERTTPERLADCLIDDPCAENRIESLLSEEVQNLAIERAVQLRMWGNFGTDGCS